MNSTLPLPVILFMSAVSFLFPLILLFWRREDQAEDEAHEERQAEFEAFKVRAHAAAERMRGKIAATDADNPSEDATRKL